MAVQVRTAVQSDLESLISMYRRLTAHMEQNGVHIWDDYYPCPLLEGDIDHGRLYAIFDGEEPMGAFALCRESAGAQKVQWEEQNARAFYIERLGVSVDYLRQGIASTLLEQAAEKARADGAEYLRLFAAVNNPASLSLYRKCGFRQAAGVYREVIDTDWILEEYGFELPLK